MRIKLHPVSRENDKLLRDVFHQMTENLTDSRTRNLITKHIKDYRQAEDYLNDKSLVSQWRGAGRLSIDSVGRFLDDFHKQYKTIVGGHPEIWTVKLAAIDYPFLNHKELVFVSSFLKTEGRYPVLFLAHRYFQRTSNRQSQVFARANGIVGGHTRFEDIGEKYGITRERVRQLSIMDITNADDAGQVWNRQRWQAAGLLLQPLLTKETLHWDELRQKEHLADLDFFAALAIFRQLTSLNVVALRADGRRANARLSACVPWQDPDVLFAYDSQLDCFSFENALAQVGHEASLQRVTESRMSLSALVDQHFTARHTDDDRKTVTSIILGVLSAFNGVVPEGDELVFPANRLNYMEEIYQILQRRGHEMTVDDIYEEFRRLHPDDHHTESSFIRSYMLRDGRFQAVGSTSTYQLREWERFAGALGDLAVHLLQHCDEPVRMTELCRQMMQVRPATTMKSCSASVHIAAGACRLLFYVDVAAPGETVRQDDAHSVGYYVGLFDRQYPSRFWPSPMTVDGTVRSMRRFLEQYGRWPFSSGREVIESALYYALRKYSNKRRITDEELIRYQQDMADIDSLEYPSCERDLLFLNRCRQLTVYCEQYHRLPATGKLREWYRSQCSQAGTFTGFRKRHFQRLQDAISASCKNT